MVYASLCLVIFNNYYYLFMWYLQCCYVVCNITLGFFFKNKFTFESVSV